MVNVNPLSGIEDLADSSSCHWRAGDLLDKFKWFSYHFAQPANVLLQAPATRA